MKRILIIGSLFITAHHEKQIIEAGYEIERIPDANPSEELLVEKIKGKIALINGGISKITDPIFEAADQLKVVSFTGADWKSMIPGYETAKSKGIKISNAPGGNSGAVAEFSIALSLLMQRRLREIGGDGTLDYLTANTLNDSQVGVIGAGQIGSKIIKTLLTFSPSKVRYIATAAKPELENIGAEFTDLPTVFKESDVIFVAVPGSMGQIFDRTAIESLKKDALVIHVSPKEMIDFDALLNRLNKGTLRFALDWPAPEEGFTKLPPNIWYNTNNHLAYNTTAVVKKCSDMATESLLDMLNDKEAKYRVI